MKAFLLVSGQVYKNKDGLVDIELGSELRSVNKWERINGPSRVEEMVMKNNLFKDMAGPIREKMLSALTVTNEYVFTVAVIATQTASGTVKYEISQLTCIEDMLSEIAKAKKGGYLVV